MGSGLHDWIPAHSIGSFDRWLRNEVHLSRTGVTHTVAAEPFRMKLRPPRVSGGIVTEFSTTCWVDDEVDNSSFAQAELPIRIIFEKLQLSLRRPKSTRRPTSNFAVTTHPTMDGTLQQPPATAVIG